MTECGGRFHNTATIPNSAPDSDGMTASRLERLLDAKVVEQEPFQVEGSVGVHGPEVPTPAPITTPLGGK